jgi:hypothetical protein
MAHHIIANSRLGGLTQRSMRASATCWGREIHSEAQTTRHQIQQATGKNEAVPSTPSVVKSRAFAVEIS